MTQDSPLPSGPSFLDLVLPSASSSPFSGFFLCFFLGGGFASESSRSSARLRLALRSFKASARPLTIRWRKLADISKGTLHARAMAGLTRHGLYISESRSRDSRRSRLSDTLENCILSRLRERISHEHRARRAYLHNLIRRRCHCN